MTRARALRLLLIGALITLIVGRWLAVTAANQLWAASLGVSADHADMARLRLSLLYWTFSASAVWYTGNLYLIFRSIHSVVVPRRLANIEIVEALPRRYLAWGFAGGALLLALAVSYGSGDWWTTRALAGAAEPTGVVDPILGLDLGEYLFRLPWRRTLHGFATLLILVTVGVSGVLYAAVGAFQVHHRRVSVNALARRHLGSLLVVASAVIMWGYRLEIREYVAGLHGVPFDTVLVDVRLPAARTLAVLSLVPLVCSLLWIRFDRIALLAFGWLALATFSVVGHYVLPPVAAGARTETALVPRDFHEARHAFNALAYGVQTVDSVHTTPAVRPGDASIAAAQHIPVWDERAARAVLEAVGTALNGGPLVAFGPGWYHPGAGPAAPLWIGVGAPVDSGDAGAPVLAMRADSTGADGLPLLLQRAGETLAPGTPTPLVLPPRWFAPGARGFRLVEAAEEGDAVIGVVPGAWFRRVALAWELQSRRMLSRQASGTRVVWHRDVRERLEAYAPFAHFGQVLPVLDDGRLQWLAYGYVAADGFPMARTVVWRERAVRYLHAGFLGVVDATSGRTRVYLLPEPDPVSAAWGRLAPGIVTPFEAVPASMVDRLPYPPELFDVQRVLWSSPEPTGGRLFRFRAPPAALPAASPFWWVRPDRTRAGAVIERWVNLPPGDAGVRPGLNGTVRNGVLRLERWALEIPASTGAGIRSEDLRTGPHRSVAGPSGTLMLQSFYLPAEEGILPLRLAGIELFTDGIRREGPTLDAALAGVATRERPEPPGQDWHEARRWFRRLDDARQSGDWKAFGEAWAALRALLGTGRDSSS